MTKIEKSYPDHVLVHAPDTTHHISTGNDLIVLKARHKPITIAYVSLFHVENCTDVIDGFNPEKDIIDISGVIRDLGSDIGLQNLRFYAKDGNLTIKINDDKFGFGENEYIICTLLNCPLTLKDARKATFIRV